MMLQSEQWFTKIKYAYWKAKFIIKTGYQDRAISSLEQLHRALLGSIAAGENLRTIEFALANDDMALTPNGDSSHAIWAFACRLINGDQDRLWLIPDFAFWSRPEAPGWYDEMRQRAAQGNALISDEVPSAAWRGVVWTDKWVRKPLMELQNETWAEIEEVVSKTGANVMPIEDFCRYGCIVHTEGRSWSGRLKYALNCDSVSTIHDLDWTSHYYHLLVPEGRHQNYVPVKRDFSDLGRKMGRFLESFGSAAHCQ